MTVDDTNVVETAIKDVKHAHAEHFEQIKDWTGKVGLNAIQKKEMFKTWQAWVRVAKWLKQARLAKE